MRRFTFFTIAAGVGAALAYLFDPDRGRSRRAKIADQSTARARDVIEAAKARTEYQKGVAKGVIHEATDALRTERDFDDRTLMQKVKSEALGYWPNAGSIEVDITDGMVRISGSVDTESDRERLIEMVRKVEGVGLIDDRLRVEG